MKELMTSQETTALADKVKPGSGVAKALQRHADNLDSVSDLLHSSAYQPVHQAIRMLRRFSHERSYPEMIHVQDVRATAVLLKHFASTVSGRAPTFMRAAAQALEELAG